MHTGSKAQQKAAGEAPAAKRGETDRASPPSASRQMYGSMIEKELEELVAGPRRGRPGHKD